MSRPPTYEDLEALPDHLLGQILGGELVVLRTAIPETFVRTQLGRFVFGTFHHRCGHPGDWWILPRIELRLGPNIVVPDLAGWRRGRMPILPEVTQIELAPDWVAEVMSPESVRHDRVTKLGIYHRAGVTHAWLVDPETQTLEAFERSGQSWLWRAWGGDTRVRAEPFAGVDLALGEFWLPDEPVTP